MLKHLTGYRILLALSAILVLGGFVMGDRIYRNGFVHGLVEVVDIKDESCQEATVAIGTSCPTGCEAKPPAGPEALRRAPECRSLLWVATCGEECDPREGLIRTDDGRFTESGTFIIRLEEPPEGFKETFTEMGVTLESGISGLWRYKARFENPDDDLRALEKLEARILELPYTVSVERVIK